MLIGKNSKEHPFLPTGFLLDIPNSTVSSNSSFIQPEMTFQTKSSQQIELAHAQKGARESASLPFSVFW